MTDEACFDRTRLANRRLEGLGMRERVVVRSNDHLALKCARDKSIEALDYAKKSGLVPIEIDPVTIEGFTRLMRKKLVSGDATGRKAYLSAIIGSIVVSDNTIRITGSNDNPPVSAGTEWPTAPWFVNLFKNGAPVRIKLRTRI